MKLSANVAESSAQPDRGMRLLIVDDDADIVTSLVDLFQAEEIVGEIITARTEAQAREIVESQSIDIALLDIRLGQKNGLDLVPLLKQRNRNVACLMMTAYRDAKYAINAIRFGADDYLYKPLEPVHLLSTIRRFIKYQEYRNQRDRAESWFRTIFQTSDQLLFVTSNTGEIIQINAAAYMFCQTTESKAIGSKLWQLMPWSDSERLAAKLRNAFMAAGSQYRSDVELDTRAPDGKPVILEFSTRPLPENDAESEYLLVEGRDITRSKQKEMELLLRASHDELTGLPNRAYLQERLERHIATGLRRHRDLSLLFIDIDHFKKVNDGHGHEIGDRVLKTIATRISDCLRGEDIVARYSGDEFVAVLSETNNQEQAEVIAERIRDRVAGTIVLEAHNISISCSIGIALFPQHAADAENLIIKADQAMYSAKKKGRNCNETAEK